MQSGLSCITIDHVLIRGIRDKKNLKVPSFKPNYVEGQGPYTGRIQKIAFVSMVLCTGRIDLGFCSFLVPSLYDHALAL